MGFIIFIFLLFGAWCILGLLGLLFGGEDRYERQYRETRRHYEMLDAIRDQDGGHYGDNIINNVDARQVHLHEHTGSGREGEKRLPRKR